MVDLIYGFLMFALGACFGFIVAPKKIGLPKKYPRAIVSNVRATGSVRIIVDGRGATDIEVSGKDCNSDEEL